MKQYITVYCNGSGLLLFPEIAEQLGFHDGQRISASQQWEVLRANCEHGLALCQMELAMDEVFDREPKDISQEAKK